VIRILAVDDHPLLRDGLAALIGNEQDMELIAEASNGREALALFRQHKPDITLMDLQMPEMNGIDAIGAICGEFPGFASSQSRSAGVPVKGHVAERAPGHDPGSPRRAKTPFP